MAETLLGFGVGKLWDLLVRESERLQGFDEQFTELKRRLHLLRSFLKDADAKKHTDAMVKDCVDDIKDIVFDTEDLIETFLLKEELGKTGGMRKRMKRLAFTLADRRQLAISMGGISKRISNVVDDMTKYGVQPDGSGCLHSLQEIQREMRHTFPSENESGFVGLEKNVKKLVGYLVEEESIQVVSIAGMGGIGKTTLARQVFNDEMVKNHFDGVVWVCISQQFTRRYVWETILQRLSSKHGEHMTDDELQEKVFRLLETSKSLIVLDDMWKEEDWDRIKHAFPPTKGWKVLVTSRNEGVALHADPTCVTFKPEPLTPDESWTLFQRIAFPKKDTPEYKVNEEMEKMGKQMMVHCGGLPLAIKVLGGLLAAQHTFSQWERIYENIKSHIVGGTSFNDRNLSSVYHVLYLSFEELPIYLKQCFLYLSHFPEDDEIIVEDLSYYWEAEGIPRPRYYDGASIRDVGDEYIGELVKRNMVISERDGRTSRFDKCQLHDMMREVCLRRAEEENFLQIIVGGNSTANSNSPCRSRRLAVHQPGETNHIEREMKNLKLRSLLFIKEYRPWRASSLCFTKLQLMRVLDLSFSKFKGGKLPSSIGKLIHLRYLSLFMAEVTHLPSSMRNLKQLLYLNLSVLMPLYMPDFLKEMRELRYLSLPLYVVVKLELGNLVNLEKLENFSTSASNVKDLQGMTRLRRLSIYMGDEGCNVETLSSALSGMKHLENLTIKDRLVCATTNYEEKGFVLDCIHLKELKLEVDGYMPRLPEGQYFFSHLTAISLENCRLEEDPMPILEKLLHLYKVRFFVGALPGRRMVCSGGGFPQLRKLFIYHFDEWEEWIVEEGSMPLLYTLELWKCENLKELPDGLRFIKSLKELRITHMGEGWEERLSEGGQDYYKVQHIPSVMFF